MTLIELLLEVGYPKDKMYHHYSDLYVYATPLTKQVISKWCKENGYQMDLFAKMFKDQTTGRPMYDVAFQYTPFWNEKRRTN